MELAFSKYQGAGNDFILVDNRQGTLDPLDSGLVQMLCQRRLGVGADGLILVESSQAADFRMRIFNADGSEAEMCGNGIRCFYRFLDELGCHCPEIHVETHERVLCVKQKGSDVSVEMGEPCDLEWDQWIDVEGWRFQVHALNTGVPHAVHWVEDVESVDLAHLGHKVRCHPVFFPQGTNFNVAQRLGPLQFRVRTYERGVEGETLACGTGATAVALAAARDFDLDGPIEVIVGSGDSLEISFVKDSKSFRDVWMSGPAQKVFAGKLELPKVAEPYRVVDIIQR